MERRTGPHLHGRYWIAGPGDRDGRASPGHQHPPSAAHHRRVVRDGDPVGDHPGVQLPGVRHPVIPHGPYPSSLRTPRLAGDHGDHPAVDHDWFRHCGGLGPLLRRLRIHRGGRLSREPLLLVGFAVTNRAVCAQLVERGLPVVATDDAPDDQARRYAADLRVELLEQPASEDWKNLAAEAQAVVPTPGLPESHPSLSAAAAAGTPVVSEFDLAQRWDSRPTLAVTGTNGKTTVTLMAAAMLEASGISVRVAGNTETPLVEAIRDDRPAAFVVEASSFRLAHSRCYQPTVGAWLNFAPDHHDIHASLDSYRAAKAALWSRVDEDTTSVVNRDDPVVAEHAPRRGRVVTFGLEDGDFRVSEGALWAESEKLADIAELHRTHPHELSNCLAAAAVAMAGGAHRDGVRAALLSWTGLPHRLVLVAEHDGVRFYDDSKATTPHAVCAAVQSVGQSPGKAVLIAGGRNKGLDLRPLAAAADELRSVVAIGEAAPDVQQVFSGLCPVVTVESMEEAVITAADIAQSGDAVLLSPGCASFDWYGSYAERGDHFSLLVREMIGGSP
ncbi:MAG: UDP-N-acetylmuramoyl-L-alanine--D-glutamate ligase [Acidimicrobiia bacterium]|nr:UDP-N-acetylmuramoyl-L-alanine--D-glutamate ligase [Acidimicrobiia bacterium]MYB75366.1 UDP-N-acetylmuramoyl-L-alanine--D-glutamate ligase [Acidimicrobiia bacterium]MYI00963.1 UDP-N-acetylmuramoyl-L-alanine--D-glutamate ligase [Acidimicrobiia bacterium]